MLTPPKARGLYDPTWEHDACGVGAVVSVSGARSHGVVEYGKQVLVNLMHRGASGADEATGDGAGILVQIPHGFFAAEAERLKFELGPPGGYGVAMLFLPREEDLRAECEQLLAEGIGREGLALLGTRDVPSDNRTLGEIARQSEPLVRQVFIGGEGSRDEELERRLYRARKRIERRARVDLGISPDRFYIPTMSCRTICYKGMFMAPQLFAYYPDLADPLFETALAVVHQRYSTNTFPSWRLAQPFRLVAHNGEINTLRGNTYRLQGYERTMASPVLGSDLSDLLPILEPGGSDSACFDNCMELLVRAGRTAPHALMMMIPEAFGAAYHISTDKRAFYEYHAAIMEPWDGPAAMIFTDGRLVGGTLDRNGLRPSRYLVTTDGLVVLASETGVIEFPPEKIERKGRLQPGRMFLVDTEEGRIVEDNEIKGKITRQKPYRRWLEENRIELRGLFQPAKPEVFDPKTVARRLRAFGYTREDLLEILVPMAANGQEPVGSMGTDTPLAVLSTRPKLLFNYFKQLFAQVTNPPIDPLREGLVMSLMSFTGKQQNLLAETPEHCRQLKLPHPILTNEDMEQLRAARRPDFKVVTLPMVFPVSEDDPGEHLQKALDDLVNAAERAIRDGASLVVLSDREVSPTRAAIPSLLATSAVHHGLLARRLRSEAGLVIESGEPREVMHFCLLCGYGAKAVNPYMAFEAIHKLSADGDLPADAPIGQLVDQYITAVKKGILKTMSKMGISTLRSYHSAQQFEAVGLSRQVVEAYFSGTASRIEGVGLDVIAREALARHRAGFGGRDPAALDLDFGGEYHFRLDGEAHLWNPTTITTLQHAVLRNDPRLYEEFARAVNDQSRELCTLRGLFDFVPGEPAPLEEVEPAAEIVKRFNTGAMSHGSISREAHEILALAMNRLGGMSNTGEGGEDPARYRPRSDGDSLNSSIKQVASARFGVTIEYLANARVLQIKMAQGAKPGEGGQLPAHKVTEEIARLRHSTPGVSLISPPPHHDIYSIEDLAQLIYDLKCANPGVLVSVKLVSEVGVGTVAAGVAKGHADEVLISGHDGGTGASPLSSIKHAGSPWEIGLAETQQTLVLNGLRDRIVVQVDGQMRTGRDVVIGALLGAERFGFGTAALVSLGCILMRKCHLGMCPAGIATQDPDLRKRFAGKAEYLVRYLGFVAEEIRRHMAALGFRKFDDMVGHVERLSCRGAVEHWKARGLDFSAVFMPPDRSNGCALRRVRPQADRHKDHLDWEILRRLGPALEQGTPAVLDMPIRNVHRTVGAILSNHIVKRYGGAGLPDNTFQITFTGSAGQSFGAFLAAGVTLRLVGDANDYLGKGLSGGRIVVQTPPGSPFDPKRNVIAGNTLLYGATAGEVFINGLAGERFGVRNSGAVAVVEGVGDHGCEYMTAGTVVVLGRTGRNFAAGMSGGTAYVYDDQQLFDTLCNLDMVDLEPVHHPEDLQLLEDLIRRHYRWTGSPQAKTLLDRWRETAGRFVKVMPIDYRKALVRLREREQVKDESSPATEEVFR
ncbi:MAG: glutamate synthase large subunit [Thermoguttaceae bacterium]|jgi:glutamate synthase domain-containing protein 2/glutamate synthase domain-containing protein 1/glutamate synthase domain-containing protein 3